MNKIMKKEKTLVIIITKTTSVSGGSMTKTQHIGDQELIKDYEDSLLQNILQERLYKR